MNKILIFAFLLFSTFAYSQNHIGFKTGLGLSSHVSKMKDVTRSPALGVEMEFERNDRISFVLGAEYKMKGVKYLITKKNDLQENTHYLNIPFGVKWYGSPKVFISGGTFWGFHLRSDLRRVENIPDDEYFNSYQDQTSDEFGIFFNLGVSRPDRKIYGYAQYDAGIVNIKGIRNGIASRTNTVSLNIVIRL